MIIIMRIEVNKVDEKFNGSLNLFYTNNIYLIYFL